MSPLVVRVHQLGANMNKPTGCAGAQLGANINDPLVARVHQDDVNDAMNPNWGASNR